MICTLPTQSFLIRNGISLSHVMRCGVICSVHADYAIVTNNVWLKPKVKALLSELEMWLFGGMLVKSHEIVMCNVVFLK